MTRWVLAIVAVTLAAPAHADSTCDPDGVQASGSVYRICMPAPADYNGMLVIWAHGFQHAGTPVGIPEDQLCFSNTCLPALINQLGFAFATNSYSKTGLAIRQGQDDILDLVNIFSAQKGAPRKVYLVGASEGGIITTLAVEQHPDVFAAGLAACGPIGNFRLQLNYFGDARTTFQYFFPSLIPGDPFHPSPSLVSGWSDYYEQFVKPVVFSPAARSRLDQWVKVARLPFDQNDYLGTVEQSVADVLHYSVVDLNEAAETLGGFPYDNRFRWYSGSDNDSQLNTSVLRVGASPAAVAEISAHYETTGVLERPLITMHTLRDQQVPYVHEVIYDLKTIASKSWLTRHVNIPINRFAHCNFTEDEALFSFSLMLLYDAVLQDVSGLGTALDGHALAAFERRAQSVGLPYHLSGDKLAVTVR